jgi:methylmalonyl-CoA mutase N-terminal domain/subunit
MRERVGARDPASWRMRFHTQTAGSTLTAQQPLNNVVRTSYQALAAVLGGTQSLHTNSYDEALGLPTEEAVMVALRTQQILGYESGVAGVVDPLAGSYYVESLTDRLEAEASALIDRIDDFGGAVAAIEAGFQQAQIEEAAYEHARSVEADGATVVGVNRFTVEEGADADVLRVGPGLEERQVEALAAFRAGRDHGAVRKSIDEVRATASSDENLLPPMRAALEAGATVGEVAGALRDVFGSYGR